MKNLFLSVLILGLVAILLFGCTGGNNYGAQPTGPGTNPPPTTNPPSSQNGNSVTVEIKDFSFNPASLAINIGDTVTWVNKDSAPHRVVFSSSPSGSSQTEFDSLNIATGGTASHKFATAGDYSYYCSIHPSMKGSITVKTASPSPVTPPPGSGTTPPPATVNFRLLVSDAPANIGDFDSLVVAFSKARVFQTEAKYRDIELNNTSVDLTTVTDQKAVEVANEYLESGNYTKIELYASSVTGIVGGKNVEVKIPSNKLQIVKPFEIGGSSPVKFVFDINVVKTGQGYNLLPVIGTSGKVGKDISESEVKEISKEEAKGRKKTEVKTSTGGYLVDSNGMALYFFTKDVDGNSACTGACLEKWPVFYAENLMVSSDLKPSDFGTITRSDGAKQTTFNGWPLYYFYTDKAAGDMKGEGIGGVWYLAKDYSVMIANKENTTYLVDPYGKSLYYYTPDSPGVSTCSGGCLKAWPAFSAEAGIYPSALSSGDFDKVTGKDQTTYKGMPLYYYAGDKARGDMKGQGYGGIWYIVNP